jgi:hypothetical protein
VSESEFNNVSDGYHTFGELYEHRHCLFMMLQSLLPHSSWKSKIHHDGNEWDGWFIAGINLPSGQVSYHLPNKHWDTCLAKTLETAPEWDGHNSDMVIQRFHAMLKEFKEKYPNVD